MACCCCCRPNTCFLPLPPLFPCSQERDLQAQLAAQEREVSALRSTASAIAMTMRGPEAVLRSRKEERDQLQQRLRQLLSDGQSEEAAAVQAQIEVNSTC